MNNKDDFKTPILDQCRDEIHQIFVECKHDIKVDIETFNQKLVGVWRGAKLDGVTQDEFFEIISSMYPELVSKIQFPFKVFKKTETKDFKKAA